MVITGSAAAVAASPSNVVDVAALREIEEAQDTLEELGAGLERSMAELHALQDRFEGAVGRQAKLLRKSALAVANANARAEVSHVARAKKLPPRPRASRPPLPGRAASASAAELGKGEMLSVVEFDGRMEALRGRLKCMQRLMPSSGGMFVELFLGSINVRFMRKSERMGFKREYERLKMKLAPIFVIFCIICLIFEEYRWLHMILQLALSCYYVTLAVRENILRANGSNIRSWWIVHHYFTMMQGVLLLTWPNSASYARFRRPLHAFGLYNAVLMIFQTRYQMARLYTLRSLGRANEMDVASSDSTQIHWSETMMLLIPLIVLGQIMQGSQAILLMSIYKDHRSELQVLLLSLLSTANFIGNSTTTARVLLAKRAAGGNNEVDAPLSSASSSTANVAANGLPSAASSIDSSLANGVPADEPHEKETDESKKKL